MFSSFINVVLPFAKWCILIIKKHWEMHFVILNTWLWLESSQICDPVSMKTQLSEQLLQEPLTEWLEWCWMVLAIYHPCDSAFLLSSFLCFHKFETLNEALINPPLSLCFINKLKLGSSVTRASWQTLHWMDFLNILKTRESSQTKLLYKRSGYENLGRQYSHDHSGWVLGELQGRNDRLSKYLQHLFWLW